MRKTWGTLVMILVVLMATGIAQATVDYNRVYQDTLKKWTRSVTIQDTFSVRATFWSEELIQAWVAKYGKENLLSSEEQLAYHRDFIQREQLGRYLMFEVTIKKLKGAPLYPINFAKNTFLVDDKGKVYFSRFDKNGNPFITPETKSITLFVNKISLDPGLVSAEVKLEFSEPYIAPDYSRPEWKPNLAEEILRLEERVKDLEFKKERLAEDMKKVEEEMQRVKDKIRELQKMK